MNTSIDGWTFLNKDLGREQVEEILDVANWCASPYGTTEYELLNYGVEGEHFTLGEDGSPVYTEFGSKLVQAPINYKQMCGQVQTFLTGDPDVVRKRFEFHASVQEFGAENPFAGMRLEPPASAKTAAQTLWDQQSDIAYGRADLASIPEIVETYLSNGGESAREYYTEAYESIHGE
jgi:putative aldouronate transport system substrate-binding protein